MALFGIPVMYLFRFMDLDASSFPYKEKPPSFFFDRLYPFLLLIITFASVPFFLAISGILSQDTVLHSIFTGAFEHTGIHHGWVGWFLALEGYLYHRLNRHALKNRHLGEAWRNCLTVLGMFLFLEDFWGEQISHGVLGWPDLFLELNQKFPFSWDINLLFEIIILVLCMLIALWLYLRFQSKHGKEKPEELK